MPASNLDNTRELVERSLERYLPETTFPEILHKAMRYSLLSGGKRFRAVLVIESARSINSELEPEIFLPTACAIEFIHTYSLIHDDLPALDNDDLRRGVETNHKVFGENMAILAGDALLTEAFHVISREQQSDDPVKIIRVIREVAAAAGANGMVGGQVADILAEGQIIDGPALEFIHRNKTGALICASARSGAILAGADEQELSTITEFAANIGLAFQITDDILDVVGNTETLGKTAGSDIGLDKATYPSIFGLDEAKLMARYVTEKAFTSLENLRGDTGALKEMALFICERDH